MILTDKGLGDAIQEYIEKDEKDSISELINFQIDRLQVRFFLVDACFFFLNLFILNKVIYLFFLFKKEIYKKSG